MSGIGITRLDLTAAELCAAAGQSRDAKSASRMLALALVLEGVDRTRAAETCGVRRVRKLSGGQFPRRTDTAPMPKVWRGCPQTRPRSLRLGVLVGRRQTRSLKTEIRPLARNFQIRPDHIGVWRGL